MTHLVIIPCSRSATRRALDAVRTTTDRLRDRVERSIAPLAARVGRLPAWAWPVAAAAAGWPSLAWMLRRIREGNDPPLAVVAWIALGFALTIARRRFAHPPRGRLLLAAASVALIAAASGTVAIGAIADLSRALLVSIAIVLALAAIVDDDEPFLPYAGFALLAWPGPGLDSIWSACFTACLAAWLFRTSTRATLKRLPIVGLVISAGVVARETLLVVLDVGDHEWSIRQGIGFVVGAIVCVVIVAVFAHGRDRVRARRRIRVESPGRFVVPRPVRAGTLIGAILFGAAALVPLAHADADPAHPDPAEAPRPGVVT